MARGRGIKPDTYWPNTGDELENHSDGINWVAERTNKWTDEKTGLTVRYGLLIGRHPDFGDTPLPVVIKDSGDKGWLEAIDVIQRKKPGGLVAYTWDEVSESWRS